ncbi:MAG: nitrate reductase [Cyanobacteria bacterium M_surface_10_m1_298]|nr:nitrate reductase [Cyanobacteria bacterium M_surface_10_m1_298]
MAIALPQAQHCFSFEQDFLGSWRCIPLCVRRKLDLIGLKLKLSHWLAMSQPEREEIVLWPDDPPSLRTLRAHLQTLTAAMAEGEAKPLPAALSEPWQQTDALPPDVERAAAQRGISLSVTQWARLAELERFALCKLARPGHDHHNLEAAFSEVLLQPPPNAGSLEHQDGPQSTNS